MSTAAPAESGERIISSAEERRVIVASSVGTVFEWYDFYLYATLAPFFATLFFPKGNATAALLSAFVTYAAGFLVRPFGALIFGRDRRPRRPQVHVPRDDRGHGRRDGRRRLPPDVRDRSAGGAPAMLVTLRLLQGLALGGEYGGAATYVAEHAPDHRRGYATSWIQTTATVGFFMALLVIYACRAWISPADFANWGWRIPFILSLVLLAISIYIRLKLQESPIFQRLKAQGKRSKSPIKDSFFKYPNNKYAALALFGATAGQGVVWYTGQFYALFFLTITLKMDWQTAYTLIALSLLLGTGFFIVFGALSDKIGRLKIILFGCLIAALTYIPLFKGLTHYGNPSLEKYQDSTPVSIAGTNCQMHIFVTPFTKFSPCDKAQDFMSKQGLSFTTLPPQGDDVVIKIGSIEIKGYDEAKLKEAMKTTGYPSPAFKKDEMNFGMVLLILFIMVIYVTMVYGPIAAFLVELFPANIRYTSMSLPYHIGNGWFGGMLPLIATAWVAASGNIYQGLWYPIIVSVITVVIGGLFLRETKDVKIHEEV